MKISKILKGGVVAVFATLLIAAPSFARIADCVGEGSQYPNLSTSSSDEYSVKCPINVTEDNQSITLYGKTSGDCASAGTLATNPDSCKSSDLSAIIKTMFSRHLRKHLQCSTLSEMTHFFHSLMPRPPFVFDL